MRSTTRLVLGIAIVFTWGCVGSVNPIVSDAAAHFDPRLLGMWTDSAAKETALVTQAGPRTYAIRYTDAQGQTMSLIGAFGAGPGPQVLDVHAAPAALGPYKDLVVALHVPIILDSIGTRIRAAVLEQDSLVGYLRRDPAAIAHVRSGDGIVLTADSPEVQRFLAAYIRRPGAVATFSTWSRRSPG